MSSVKGYIFWIAISIQIIFAPCKRGTKFHYFCVTGVKAPSCCTLTLGKLTCSYLTCKLYQDRTSFSNVRLGNGNNQCGSFTRPIVTCAFCFWVGPLSWRLPQVVCRFHPPWFSRLYSYRPLQNLS